MKLERKGLGTLILDLNPTLTVLPALVLGLIFSAFSGIGYRFGLQGVLLGGLILSLLAVFPTVAAGLFSTGARRRQVRQDGRVPAKMLRFLDGLAYAAAFLGVLLGSLLNLSPARKFLLHRAAAPFSYETVFNFVSWPILGLLFLGIVLYLAGSSAVLTKGEGTPVRTFGLSLCRVMQNVTERLIPWLLPLAAFVAAWLFGTLLFGPDSQRVPVSFRFHGGLTFVKTILPLVLVPLLGAFGTAYYLLRRCGRDCPDHFAGFFKRVLLQAATCCSRGRCGQEIVHNLSRLGVRDEEALVRTRAGLLWSSAATTFYIAFVCTLLLPNFSLAVRVVLAVLVFCFSILAGRADLPVSSAGLMLVILSPGLFHLNFSSFGVLGGLTLLFMLERYLDIVRTVANVLLTGVAVYLSDKLGW
ncbi:MAG: hypothetical protein VZQ81_02695 [Succiniclasticum sp.]|nr:hypothetical protein [Succiniclasticum sp.]MEE3478918.1 hypothetical protein [Succiniclasticum sp.]